MLPARGEAMSLTLNVPMDAEMRHEFVSYIYKRWCEAFDAKKAAHSMVFSKQIHGDKASYEGFKEEAITSSKVEFQKWDRILNSFKDYSPLIRQELGLEP